MISIFFKKHYAHLSLLQTLMAMGIFIMKSNVQRIKIERMYQVFRTASFQCGSIFVILVNAINAKNMYVNAFDFVLDALTYSGVIYLVRL